MPEIVVVGGGIGGLAVGAMLASDGHEVHVLEKSGQVGGRALPWTRDGFTVDHGVHLVRYGNQSALAEVFRHIGHQLSFRRLGASFVAFADGSVERLPLKPSDIVATGMIDDRERAVALGMLAFWRGADPSRRLASSADDLLEMFGVKQKLAPYLGTIASHLRERWNESRWRERLDLLEPEHTMEMSVAEWLDALDLGTGLRQYFQLWCAAMLTCPFVERASAGEMIASIKRAVQTGSSLTYPASGWRHILTTLSAVIERSGAIKLNTEVARVQLENNRAAGVELASGDTIRADHVVLDVSPAGLLELFEKDEVDGGFVERCRAIRPVAGVALDYGLTRPVNFDSGLWTLWQPMAFGVFTSNLCPETAPSGKQIASFMMPVGPRELETRAAELEEELETELFRTFRGLEDAVQWRRASHIERVAGAEPGHDQHRGLRPETRVPGLDNTYLVGDWLRGAGAGSDVTCDSALACAQAMQTQMNTRSL